MQIGRCCLMRVGVSYGESTTPIRITRSEKLSTSCQAYTAWILVAVKILRVWPGLVLNACPPLQPPSAHTARQHRTAHGRASAATSTGRAHSFLPNGLPAQLGELVFRLLWVCACTAPTCAVVSAAALTGRKCCRAVVEHAVVQHVPVVAVVEPHLRGRPGQLWVSCRSAFTATARAERIYMALTNGSSSHLVQ
jgi:hypothetical protein